MQLRIDSLESELAHMHLERGSNMPAGSSSLWPFGELMR